MSEAADRRIQELENDNYRQSLLMYALIAASGGELFVPAEVTAKGIPENVAISMEEDAQRDGWLFKLVGLDDTV